MFKIKYRIKKLIDKVLYYAGLQLVQKKQALIEKKQKITSRYLERLKHIKHLGFEPKVIFDCGAFVGWWAIRVSEIFPNASFLLVEPNHDIIARTKTNIEKIPSKTILLNVAVGEKSGLKYLNVWENTKHMNRDVALAGSSILSHVSGTAARQIPIETQTLDVISSKYKLIPDLVKLDLQGSELAALKGATSLFGKTELFIVEFGCLDAYINRTTPRDLVDIMYDNGYCLYDIVDLGYRPYDKALCGGDFFFIKMNSKLKEHKDYF